MDKWLNYEFKFKAWQWFLIVVASDICADIVKALFP